MYPFLVTCILGLILSKCKAQNGKCNVTPKDLFIEVGSDAKIVCQTSCVSGKVSWMLNNRHVDESLSNVVNSTHTELSLRNITQSNATVECLNASKQVVGGTIIKTYSKPREIFCILHYENGQCEGVPQLFTCTWEHLSNSSLTNYTVFVSSSPARQSEICNSSATECTAKNINKSGKINLFWNISVTVRAKTADWEAYSDPHVFIPREICKICPPQVNVTVMSNHLLTQWNSKGSRCQIKYGKAVSHRPPAPVNEILNLGRNGTELIKVESCSNYKVSARCALVVPYWSDWSPEKAVMTELNKSDVHLRLWRKISTPDESGVRKVLAMWMGILSTCRGTFTYKVKQIPYERPLAGVSSTSTVCSTSTCCVDVNRDTNTTIHLTVSSNQTLLAEDSVYVPATGESLPGVSEIQTSAVAGVILISWRAPAQPVTGYMIDWTHDGNQYYWKESKYTNTTLFELLDKTQYSITVTPLFGDRAGHGAEALHVCSGVGAPKNITVNVQPYDRSASVRWNTNSQEECTGAVVNYTVFYSTQRGPTISATVDGTKQDIILKDLNPVTQYRVYIRATASTGTTQSSERLFTTTRFDPRLITVISISGSIVIILVLSVGLCCAIQWKKYRERQVPNPALSSLALWPVASQHKGKWLFEAFSNQLESFCDRVYTEDRQITAIRPPATGCYSDPASDQIEEYTDPAIVLAPDAQSVKPPELVETQTLGPPGESVAFLPSENSTIKPYRSQSSVETPPPPRTSKQCKHMSVEKHEKTSPKTLYITLNMFEQSQGK